MRYQNDAGLRTGSPPRAVAMPGARAPRPAVLLRVAMLAAIAGLAACSNRPRVQSYTLPQSGPPPVRDMNTASRLRIAEAADNSGNVEMAAALYGAAAAAEPGRADLQARFASALQRSGNLPRAEEVLTRALERNPNDVALNLQLGRLRLRTGAADQALAVFDRVLARNANNADALDGRGVALDLLDRPSEAQQAYIAARAQAPADLRISANLAFSYLLEGRAQEARDVLEPFAGRADLPTRARTSLAIARAMTGNQDGAIALLGPGVTREDLDQLVAGLPNSRPSVAARGRPAAAAALPASAEAPAADVAAAPAAAAVGPADASEAAFRPYTETARTRRPARARREPR